MGNKKGLTKDYRTRRGELSAFGRATNSELTLRRLLIALLIVIGAITLGSVTLIDTAQQHWLKIALVTLAGCAGIGLIAVGLYARKNFIEPDLAFRKWLQQVCDGDLGAQIGLPQSHAHYKELHFHTNNLATALKRLSTDMESLVDTQTQRLEYQNKSLDLLYNLTSDVSNETDKRAVLETVCRYLADWFGDAVVCAYLVDEDPTRSLTVRNETRHHKSIKQDGMVAEPRCGSSADLQKIPDLIESLEYVTSPNGESLHKIRLPFFNDKKVAGMIVIDTDEYKPSNRTSLERMLTTISEQLSLFLAKQSASEQSRTTQLVRDRNALAADIHDSLAQTLAALRYQVTFLLEALEKNDNAELYDDVIRIQGMIGEANQEVRGLIQEFRLPLSQRRSSDALRATVDAFRSSSGMQVFFQTNDSQISFTPREESQLQRIIREALNNAAKYSQASMLRVYLRSDEVGIRRILIEDDGIGFVHNEIPNNAVETKENGGNHIGLSIMQERACSIGATLGIETEPGEGTRVSIELPPHAKFAGDPS